MKIDPVTVKSMAHTAAVLAYQNTQMEIKSTEEKLRQDRLRLQRLKPNDPNRGQNIDVYA